MEHIFELIDFHYSYGEINAVRGVNLYVDPGEIVALIGANGAGKTTTLQCISGLIGRCKSGKILYMGKDITDARAIDVARMGLIHVLEGRMIFPLLTVYENLLMGAYLNKNRTEVEKLVGDMYQRFPRLGERKSQLAGTLSGGEQQMLAVARALMAKPKMLLMDEPSLGLAPMIVKEVFSIIKDINSEGISVLLVEQNSKAALEIASRGYVLEMGKVAIEGDAKDLLHDESIIRSYLGGNGAGGSAHE